MYKIFLFLTNGRNKDPFSSWVLTSQLERTMDNYGSSLELLLKMREQNGKKHTIHHV